MLRRRPPRLLAAALLCVAAAAWSQPMRLAFSELEPWKTHKGQQHGGAYTEIMRELARRTGLQLVFIDCPLKRCLRLLELGEADVAIGLQESPERLHYLHYLATPYRTTSSDRVFLVRAGDKRRITQYDDLVGLRIAVKQGSDYFDRFDDDTRLIKDAAPTNEASLRKLLLGRVDVVMLPDDQAQAQLALMKLHGEIDFAPLRIPEPTPRAVAVSRASPLMARLPQLEKAMRDLRDDGTLVAIYSRHYYQRYGLSRQVVAID